MIKPQNTGNPRSRGMEGRWGTVVPLARPRPCASVAVAVDRSSRVNVLKYTYSVFQPEHLDTHSGFYNPHVL